MLEPAVPPFDLLGAETGNCLRVAVALEVLGLAYNPVYVDLRADQQRSAAFRAINPDGRVPVLIDRSQAEAPLTLTQSNAIMLYLSDLRPGKLLPEQSGPARARALEQFLYFVTDGIAPNGNAFLLKRRDQSAAASHLKQRSIEAIAASERFLDNSSYMAGDTISLPDIAAVVVVRASSDRLDWTNLPRLRGWLNRVSSRSDVQRGLTAFDNQRSET